MTLPVMDIEEELHLEIGTARTLGVISYLFASGA